MDHVVIIIDNNIFGVWLQIGLGYAQDPLQTVTVIHHSEHVYIQNM